MSDAPRYDSGKPQVFLPGASIEQAKGVAMGSAVSKGWEVASSSARALVLQRPLNAAAAESVADGGAPATVQVDTGFFERDQGVDVVVGATVITNEGTEAEKREDYTETYRPDLERSLSSLRSTWSRTGGRVASATPPLPAGEVPAPVDPNVPLAPTGAAAATTAATTDSASVPGTGIGTGWLGGPAAAAAPVVDASRADAPPTAMSSSAPSQSMPGPVTTPGSAENNMMALNQPAPAGVWAYYAEHYARVRGCQLTSEGAVLMEKTPDYEMHQVACEGGQTFQVRCNAGVCRGMR